MEFARVEDRILISYDKDFFFFKHKLDNYLIIIDVHPLIDENVLPIFQNYLKLLNINDLKDNFVILKKDEFILKKKG